MIRRLAVCLFVALVALPALAAPPRAVVQGHQPPAGLTVLDRRGDLWLVSGTEAELAALPGARLLAEPAVPAAPARTFIPAPTPVIDDLVAQVDPADLLNQAQWVVDLGVRYTLSPNILVVADALEARLASYGLATEQRPFVYGSLPVTNVIGTRVGRVHPDSVFVICAHYDATSKNPYANTPGADDNASGTVAVLTAARLLSQVAVDYTIKFVLFAGEEQGMVGSSAWVAEQAAAGLPIVGALNFDMIAWWVPGVPLDLEIETNHASRWLADAICWAADTFTTMPYILHVDDSAWWGDFYPFWQHGYAAVNHEEAWDWSDPDFNPRYHTGLDTVEELDPDFFAGSVKIAVAALATLAGVADVSAVPGVSAAVALKASPNPFNGRVVISLAADGVEGPVAVGVFDVRGRRVGAVTLAMSGGWGEAHWDARAADGRALPAGVYLARVKAQPEWPACRITYVP